MIWFALPLTPSSGPSDPTISLAAGYYDVSNLEQSLRSQGVELRVKGAEGKVFAISIFNRSAKQFIDRFAETCDFQATVAGPGKGWVLDRPPGYAVNCTRKSEAVRSELIRAIKRDLDRVNSAVSALRSLSDADRQPAIAKSRTSTDFSAFVAGRLVSNELDPAMLATAPEELADARTNPFRAVEFSNLLQIFQDRAMDQSTLIQGAGDQVTPEQLEADEAVARLFWEPRYGRITGSFVFTEHNAPRGAAGQGFGNLVPDYCRPAVDWTANFSPAERSSLMERVRETSATLRTQSLQDFDLEHPVPLSRSSSEFTFSDQVNSSTRISASLLKWSSKSKQDLVMEVSETLDTEQPTVTRSSLLKSVALTSLEPDPHPACLQPSKGYTLAFRDGYLEVVDNLSFLDRDLTLPETVALPLDRCDAANELPSLDAYLSVASLCNPMASNHRGLPDSLAHRPGFISSLPYLALLRQLPDLASRVKALKPGDNLIYELTDATPRAIGSFLDALQFSSRLNRPDLYTCGRLAAWNPPFADPLPECEVSFTRTVERPRSVQFGIMLQTRGADELVWLGISAWTAELRLW